MMLGAILYGLLGLVLGMAGVNVMDKPFEFFLILGLVVVIDLNTKFNT